MKVEFSFNQKRLAVRFLNLSSEVDGLTPLWDFGDGTTSDEENPTHEYEKLGRYTVTLSYQAQGDEDKDSTSSQVIMVSDKVFTVLSDTIYRLIDYLLPEDIFGEITAAQKHQLISKWQLYLAPLVNHHIPLDEFTNELYFEALENQLVMEAAAYDLMVLKVNLMVQGYSKELTNSSITSSSSGGGGATEEREGSIKKITTGPSEVEFFNDEDYYSEVFTNVIRAMDPEGIIALMKQQLCMLAERLDIYLPICPRLPQRIIVPKVVNRRNPGFLGGPDPMEVLGK